MEDLSPMPPHSSRPRLRTRADTGWFLTGYAGILGFFGLEAATREPGAASSLRASGDDRGTTRKIGIAYVLATELPPVLRQLSGQQLPRWAGPVGLGVQASGLVLRTWSMRTLSGAYTRTLRTDDDQHVVTSGPYRWVRHPGYTGSLLTWAGYALTSRSLPALAVVTALLGRVYYQRFTAEEALLTRELPGYAAYSERTRKLVPFLW